MDKAINENALSAALKDLGQNFSGALFDLLESFVWDYLVKVKLKNLKYLLGQQTWILLEGKKDIAICEFAYKANGWSKPRVLKAMRSVKEYVQVEYLGEKQSNSWPEPAGAVIFPDLLDISLLSPRFLPVSAYI